MPYVIVVAVLLLAAGILVFTTAKGRDTDRAIGALSRETKKRDRSAQNPVVEELVSVGAKATGREVERAARYPSAPPSGGDLVRAAKAAPPAVRAPMDAEALGVTRRQFLNRSITGTFALALAGFGATMIAFLWPSLQGGFGSKIKAGSLADILATIRDTKTPVYKPEGRFYLQPFPKDDAAALAKAAKIGAYAPVLPGMQAGVVALYQKCVHLGCRVPWCSTSQWFECPCHGSKYNRVGEKKGGPAPRGLDRFVVIVEGDQVTVDTGKVIQGPAIGTNTTGQEQEGPHCA